MKCKYQLRKILGRIAAQKIKLISILMVILAIFVNFEASNRYIHVIKDLFRMGNTLPLRQFPKDAAMETISNLIAKETVDMINIKFPIESAPPSGTGNTFSVLSYNVLADVYTSGMERDCSPFFLNFEYRSPIILEELKRLDADIILLQELDHFDDFYKAEFEKLGYGAVVARRVDRPDCAFVGYKKSVFELQSEDKISFDQGHRYEKNMDFWRRNVAAVAILKHKQLNKIVNVLGTHFFWNPKQEHVKYFQMELVLKYINSKFKKDDIIVWGGDLNSKPNDNNILYLKNRRAPIKENIEFFSEQILKYSKEMYEELQKLEDPIDWGNAYEYYGPSIGKEEINLPMFTNYSKDFKSTIDHIFYNKRTIAPRKFLKIPDTENIRDIALPNQRYPSDHLPIMSVFEILL